MSDEDKIDDDTFAYEGSGGMRQCISGFGRNAIRQIGDDLDLNMPGGRDHTEARERLSWHVEELVRWCRHFNGKALRLERSLAARDATIAEFVDKSRAAVTAWRTHLAQPCRMRDKVEAFDEARNAADELDELLAALAPPADPTGKPTTEDALPSPTPETLSSNTKP